MSFTTSAVFLDNPPRLPRVPMLRMNTFSFNVKSFIRIRSPKIAPPENGLVVMDRAKASLEPSKRPLTKSIRLTTYLRIWE